VPSQRRAQSLAIRRLRRRRGEQVRAGLIAIVLVVVGTYLAFQGELPFRDHYELKAVFQTSNNVKKRQPVRIAGVQVGEVTSVEATGPGDEQALVTMRIEEEGLPLYEDAQLKIRPRLFLEGNWFLDLEPGTPGAGKFEDGDTIPIQNTRTPVQLGQVLNTLQSDTRENIRQIFQEYGSAVSGAGARGYRRSIPYWESAYRDQAIVQDATRGEKPRDLSEYIDGAGRVARGLDRSPQALKSLVTDFNIAAGAFAREATALETAIEELPRTLRAAQPALAALNEAFPPLRRFARDLRPSIREQGRTIDVAFPFLQQTRRLVSQAELRGLAADLRPTVPDLARLSARSIPLYEQLRLAASCENHVILPWANDRVDDPNFPATGSVSEEAPKSLVGLAGESRTGDANGQWARVLTSAGEHTVQVGPNLFAQSYFPVLGTNPPKPVTFPSYREDVPCETQEPPDLRSTPGPGEPTIASGPLPADALPRYRRARDRAVGEARRMLRQDALAGSHRVSPREPGLRDIEELGR
jgi:phospholipid/cholesterol/gamma-HCH transport system substrate-binding protein